MLAVQVQSTKYTEQKWTGNCRNNPDESFAKISSSISNSIKLERGLNRQTSALKIKSFAKEQANSLKGSHQTSCIYSLWFAGQKKKVILEGFIKPFLPLLCDKGTVQFPGATLKEK